MDDSSDSRRAPNAAPLQVGIIGLGRRWQQRYRPALLALRDRFRIAAVCDQVQERAALEARRLGCVAATGPMELLERRDTDAVLLADPQWYRLWPVEAACGRGKPVFCGDALERDEEKADALYEQVQQSGLPVMMALAPRYTPAAMKLRELLQQRGARADLVLCSVATRATPRQAAANPPGDPLPFSLALLDWCTSFCPEAPSQVLAAGLPDGRLTTLLLRYRDGRAVQLNAYQGPSAPRATQLHLLTDRGTALARLPGHVCWTDSEGRTLPRLGKAGSVVQTLLEQFHAAVTGGQPVTPDLAHAYRLLTWRRLAVRSFREGGWVDVPSP
jgi:predicted dehydrogenase